MLRDPKADDLVVPTERGTIRHEHTSLDLLQRDAARIGIPARRFHDLRHTFGSIAISEATIIQVQAWMGHADIQTTMKYMHHRSRADDAKLLSAAFRPKKKRKPATKRTGHRSTNAVPA